MSTRPKPTQLSAPFWAAARAHRLVLQRCDNGHYRWTPQMLCDRCLSEHYSWEEVSGRGTIYSHSVVHRPPLPEFAAPYVVAVIELEEGPLMLSTIVDWRREDLEIGRAVEVRWQKLDDEITLYPFAPA
jgi:uncharacterized OB-fold protein